MQEELIDFKKMVKEYYEDFGKYGMVCDFLHIIINYTYIDLNSRLVDLDSSGIPMLNNGKRKRDELISIPIVIHKSNYEELFSDDEDYSKRTFKIEEDLNLGTSYNFNYQKVYENIKKIIPSECHIINDGEVRAIANMNGYENIYWNTFDKNDSVLSIYGLEPVWVDKVYGIKMIDKKEDEKSWMI